RQTRAEARKTGTEVRAGTKATRSAKTAKRGSSAAKTTRTGSASIRTKPETTTASVPAAAKKTGYPTAAACDAVPSAPRTATAPGTGPGNPAAATETRGTVSIPGTIYGARTPTADPTA